MTCSGLWVAADKIWAEAQNVRVVNLMFLSNLGLLCHIPADGWSNNEGLFLITIYGSSLWTVPLECHSWWSRAYLAVFMHWVNFIPPKKQGLISFFTIGCYGSLYNYIHIEVAPIKVATLRIPLITSFQTPLELYIELGNNRNCVKV